MMIYNAAIPYPVTQHTETNVDLYVKHPLLLSKFNQKCKSAGQF